METRDTYKRIPGETMNEWMDRVLKLDFDPGKVMTFRDEMRAYMTEGKGNRFVREYCRRRFGAK